MKLDRSFYLREDVVLIARELLGKHIFTCFEDGLTGGVITETEAYAGIIDRASHAYNNRRTRRTEVMFGKGGHAYVYLCYGIHSLFNIVTNIEDVPHAVLIRGIFPKSGLDIMQKRTTKPLNFHSGIGPGRVSALLGIHYSHSGADLSGDHIWLENRNIIIADQDILAGPRVGVAYAGQDAMLPYRFTLSTNKLNSWK
ncbi:MAG: DNA-3-methyladenine glycosylase [Bacteroidales bacterium]|nr:DNA-3-methyladenine glycosylase [Bacteroidales bacterium]